LIPPSSRPGSSIADLLREAGAAARAGDRSEAERLYRRVIDRSPANIEAWLGLGTVLEEPERKAECFQRVLEIEPQNQEAAASLERLRAVLPAMPPAEMLECAFHPGVRTVLRCSQCGRPICTRCARPYPVGQLCPICVQGRRPPYYQPGALNLALAGGATLLASGLFALPAAFLVSRIWFLALLGGPMVGSILAQVALLAGQRHRGMRMQIVVGAGAVLGSLAVGVFLIRSLWEAPFYLLYVGLATASAVAWLR